MEIEFNFSPCNSFRSYFNSDFRPLYEQMIVGHQKKFYPLLNRLKTFINFHKVAHIKSFTYFRAVLKKKYMLEKWKALNPKNKLLEGLFLISNTGKIKSVPRHVTRQSYTGSWYTFTAGGNILKPRRSKTSPLLFCSLSGNISDKHGTVTKINETAYIHKHVAEAFIKNPEPDKFDRVAHIKEDYDNNHHTNLKWCDQSFLSKRAMITHPQNRDNLKNTNIKNGYYKKRRNPESVRYFELIIEGDFAHIQNNYHNAVARRGIKSLSNIEHLFKKHLFARHLMAFKDLTPNDIDIINDLLPKHNLSHEKRRESNHR